MSWPSFDEVELAVKELGPDPHALLRWVKARIKYSEISWPSEYSKEEQDMRMKALDKEFDYPGFVANHYASHFQNGWSAAYKTLTQIHLAEMTKLLREALARIASLEKVEDKS